MTRYVEKIKGEKVLLSWCPTLRLLFEKRMQKVWVLFFHVYLLIQQYIKIALFNYKI